jgi:transposase
MYEQKNENMLLNFIEKYKNSSIKALSSFANGLNNDLAAVKNSVTSPYSNGILEGNNNRLKLIKRMMYGRAKLPLLRAKVLANT